VLCGVDAFLEQVSGDCGDVTARRDEVVDHLAVSVDGAVHLTPRTSEPGWMVEIEAVAAAD
jgi:hypothetical protein